MSTVTQGGHISTEPRINERIRVPEVRLVGPAGEQVGIVAINDALRLAQEADLDLVEVAPMARPPVCKLMDYGKFKYESALKARESRKNQAQTVIKEIKLRPKIDPHDYGTKKGHVERFLKQGDKVKVTIMFRGREQSRPELGFKLLQRLAGDIEELGFVESSPKQDGRNMIMVLGPHKRKTEALAAAKADRASRSSARSAEHAAARRLGVSRAAGRQPKQRRRAMPRLEFERVLRVQRCACRGCRLAAHRLPALRRPGRLLLMPSQTARVRPVRSRLVRSRLVRDRLAPASRRAEQASTEQARRSLRREHGRAANRGERPEPTPSGRVRRRQRRRGRRRPPGIRRAEADRAARRARRGTAAWPGGQRRAEADQHRAEPRRQPRPSASTAPKPGPARRTGDGPVPAPRAVAADRRRGARSRARPRASTTGFALRAGRPARRRHLGPPVPGP